MRIDLDITLKTNRELSSEEQEYHEFWINQFKGHFEEWFLKSGIPVSRSLHFNIEYYADKRKFKIKKINLFERKILEKISLDNYFNNKYFLE